VPDDQRHFISLNAELAKKWDLLIQKKPQPPDAEEWRAVTNKRELIER
jgi:ferredoxin